MSLNALLHLDTLNRFRAFLCQSSGALDYIFVVTAYGVQCLVTGCRGSGAGQQGVRPGRGMLHDLHSMYYLLLFHTTMVTRTPSVTLPYIGCFFFLALT